MAIPERKFSALRCPSCEQPLTIRDGTARCTACSEMIPVIDGIPSFSGSVDQSAFPSFFDLLSSVYETPLWFPVMYRVIGGPFAPADDRPMIAGLLDATDGEVLDVACGTGRFTRYIADEAAFVWGIDLSMGMLRRARRYVDRDDVDNVGFAKMAVTDLRFSSDQFDSVACCWALHLFSDIPAALSEIHRVLKSGGRFAGTTLADEYVLSPRIMQEGLRQTVGAHVFEAGELRTLLRETGFTAVELERRGAALFFRAEG